MNLRRTLTLPKRPARILYMLGLPIPTRLQLKILDKLNQPLGQQNKEELEFLLCQMKGSASILEVGSSFGHTLWAMASVAQPKAIIRSIDLGLGMEVLKGIDTSSYLLRVVDDLSHKDYDAMVRLGNSHNALLVKWARRWAPYDFIFIDGDHSYSGVLQDWLNYGPMGKMVGFHDIASGV